jgi:hypothetical protein
VIDVYAGAGTFADTHALAKSLAAELKTIERVADIPMFRKNIAAFVYELPSSHLSNVDGDSNYVRVGVLTNAGALDRDKQIAVVDRLSAVIGEAAVDPSLVDRTWVLLTEAPDGGWGLRTREHKPGAHRCGRAQIAELPRNSTEAFTPFGETGGGLSAPSTRSHGSQPSCFLAHLRRGYDDQAHGSMTGSTGHEALLAAWGTEEMGSLEASTISHHFHHAEADVNRNRRNLSPAHRFEVRGWGCCAVCCGAAACHASIGLRIV